MDGNARRGWRARRAATLLALAVAFAVAVGACGRSAPGPEETVEGIAHGLADGEVAVLWQALPPSYRRDANRLVHAFAEAVDPEVWNQSFATLAKLARVLGDKQEFIVRHPAVAEHLDPDAAGETASWEVLVETLEMLATSELSDVDKLAAFDGGRFLDHTGSRLAGLAERLSALSSEQHRAELEEKRAALRALSATLVSEEGDTATVRIEMPGESPSTETLVRVEGHWIPTTLAEQWPETVANVREWIAALAAREPSSGRNLVLMKLRMLDAGLDTLHEARTADEFDAGLQLAMGMATGAVLGAALGALETEGLGLRETPAPRPGARASRPDRERVEEALRALEGAGAKRGGSGLSEAFAPEVIPPAQAGRWLGHTLRVTTADGLDKVATLVGVEDGTLRFRQPVGNGHLSFRVRASEIQQLATAR